MLSLPLLAHPPRSADETAAATTIRHAITPPILFTPGTAAHRPWHRTMAVRYREPIYLSREGILRTNSRWDLIGPTNDRQRQYRTPADDCQQELPRILRF